MARLQVAEAGWHFLPTLWELVQENGLMLHCAAVQGRLPQQKQRGRAERCLLHVALQYRRVVGRLHIAGRATSPLEMPGSHAVPSPIAAQ